MTESDHWEGRRVLVTGGGGFLGSHVVVRSSLPAAANTTSETRRT
jgi:FlaA1/EpsC-like NDP-sugar epimerase